LEEKRCESVPKSSFLESLGPGMGWARRGGRPSACGTPGPRGGPYALVDLSEPLHVLAEGHRVGDLFAVQVLVLQALVEPLDQPVGLRSVVAGPDVTRCN
jgi:hypothetical protein